MALNAAAIEYGSREKAAADEKGKPAEEAPAALGGGVSKSASTADSSVRESDRAFLQGLGLA